ncbi:MAG: hypothetical protein H6658_02835 [Ardenticatenaceae bacterium]|nr:hypothetical protein [Ardenticatenaceae bacterium]
MIRPFDIRDLALVHRLREQGVSLHTKSALIDNLHPLRGAVVNMLVGGEFPTYVWKAEEGNAAGFIQLYVESGQQARILYLSSTPHSSNGHSSDFTTEVSNGDKQPYLDENVWLPLLDQAVAEVGARGIHSLVAEVNEVGTELPILRRAGFAVYTRQDIWVFTDHEEIRQRKNDIELTPCGTNDEWDIQLLYANTVPRLVQLVEPIPPESQNNTGWVLRENGELAAYVYIHEGEAATWLGLIIHPNADARVDDIVTAALRIKRLKKSLPVYCCIRRYQSWIQSALQRLGFTFWGSQAVMVKHTVHHTKKPLQDLSAVLEQKGISPTTTMVRHYRRPHKLNKNKKLRSAE